jgi:hypothetical protein
MSRPSIAPIDEVARSGNPTAEAARESLAQFAQFAQFRRLAQDAIHMRRHIAPGNESPAPMLGIAKLKRMIVPLPTALSISISAPWRCTVP